MVSDKVFGTMNVPVDMLCHTLERIGLDLSPEGSLIRLRVES